MYMKWNQMKTDPRSCERNYMLLQKPENISGLQRGLNPWPRDTGAMLYQLSYEATDVGSRSIVGSYVPVKVKNASDVYEINHMNCGNEIPTSTGLDLLQLTWIFFRLLYAIAYNCVHNCEDQPSFDFIAAVHMINFIYITCKSKTIYNM